jgi:GT2 family glycosyltransferase
MIPELSIVIIHYKSYKDLLNCLKSIRASRSKVKYEVIVVDNDKKTIKTKLKRDFKWVKYIKSNGNIGYSSGNNLGVKYTLGKYLLFLNPDTEVFRNTIDSLVSYLKNHRKTYMVAPIILDKNLKLSKIQGYSKLDTLTGVVTLSFINKLFPNNFISRSYFLKDRKFDHPENVDVVSGSAFMIRKDIFEKVGGFDQYFFLYFEESDLCKRIKDLKGKIVILPYSKIIHLWGRSTKDKKLALKEFERSRFYYFKKHYGSLSAYIVEAFAKFSRSNAKILFVLILIILIIILLK